MAQGITHETLLENRDVKTPGLGHEGRRETDRSRANDGEPPLGQRSHLLESHPLRVIVLQAWTQCAIVPPPLMTAATPTASAISSGLIPASAQADVYESMQ